MGGPPGARGGNRRRGYPHEWELRDAARFSEQFEILDSEEDDGQGVTLDPNSFAMRDARQRGYAGDALYFDGYDLGQDRGNTRRGMYDAAYDEYLSEEDGYQDPRASTRIRQKQDFLLQSALDRIARARAKGHTNVSLTQEEMEVLERRGSQQPDPPSSLASPPATPAKTKVKTASRNSSTNSLNAKTRKRSTSGFFSSPAKSNSKAKMSRKSSVERTSPPPGHVMIEGPDGLPMYAPIYQGPSSPERVRSTRSQAGSRSSSKQSRRAVTPPDQLPPLPHPPRFFQGVRPDSQGSNHSIPEDTDWYLPSTRTRSSSNAHPTAYRPPEDYDMAQPLPAAQGRRHVSGPPDVRYAALRRAAPPSPLSARATPVQPSGSALRRVETSGSSSSDDQGVLVDIVPDDHGGFAIRNLPAQSHKAEPVPVGTTTPSKSAHGTPRKRKTRK